MIKKFLKKYFTQEERGILWGSGGKFKTLEGLSPFVTSDGKVSYPYNNIIEHEISRYLTQKGLAKRWNVPEDKLKKLKGSLIRTEIFDGTVHYQFFDVLNYERSYLLTQNQLAKRWDVLFDEIKKIDEFVSPIIIDGIVYYDDFDIYKYERSPILFLDKIEKNNRS